MGKKKITNWNSLILSVSLVSVFLVVLIFYPRDSRPYVAFHQDWIEGNYPEIQDSLLNLANVDQVFARVFFSLRDEVKVYPTENYYYFVLKVGGKQIWGNFHFPPYEEIGDGVDFAYWTFQQDPKKTDQIDPHYKHYAAAEGVAIAKLAPLKFSVSFGGKTTIFNLNNLSQQAPKSLALRNNEVVAAHTFDESGYSFYLVYNKTTPHFMFILDEAMKLPETLQTNDGNIWFGVNSGFAFYQDGNRKILIGVKAENVEINNYYDGPFDQLGDNFVSGSRLAEYMQQAYPYTKGRIDKYGRFTDVDHSRLAITPYHFYRDSSELSAIIKGCGGSNFYSCVTYDFKEASRP